MSNGNQAVAYYAYNKSGERFAHHIVELEGSNPIKHTFYSNSNSNLSQVKTLDPTRTVHVKFKENGIDIDSVVNGALIYKA